MRLTVPDAISPSYFVAIAAVQLGFFREEGIDMEFVRARPSGVVTHTEDPSEVNPILGHVAFEEARVSIYRA